MRRLWEWIIRIPFLMSMMLMRNMLLLRVCGMDSTASTQAGGKEENQTEEARGGGTMEDGESMRYGRRDACAEEEE